MKKLPLEGIRVADLTMVWAGPYATKLLAEMGAEVVKVESPGAVDTLRTLIPQPGAPEPWNSSYYFNDYNRDKKSVTLDLSHPRGRALFLELVKVSDVVVENYRADVIDNLNLGYEVLRSVKPDIILVSMAGFGKTGADRDAVGYGPIIEQMAGLASLNGYGDDGVPYKSGISYGDPIAGIAAAGAVALALIQRRKTGKGSFIDLAQRETMAAMIGDAFVAASLRGETPPHRGNRHARFVPQGAYRCLGEEQWIVVSVANETQWQALARLLGDEGLEGLSLQERQSRHDEIDQRIARWCAGRLPQDAMEALQAAGVPAGRVLDTASVHDDPNMTERGYWTHLDHPLMHDYRTPSAAWHLQEANPHPLLRAPLFGEHNREILCGLLGVSEAELAELAAAGVIGDRPMNATHG